MNQNGESSRGGQIGHSRDHSYRSSLLLFLAASIWGVAFVAQSVGMDYMGPFTFNGARSLIGGTVLLPLIAFREQKQKKALSAAEGSMERGLNKTEEAMYRSFPVDRSGKNDINLSREGLIHQYMDEASQEFGARTSENVRVMRNRSRKGRYDSRL